MDQAISNVLPIALAAMPPQKNVGAATVSNGLSQSSGYRFFGSNPLVAHVAGDTVIAQAGNDVNLKGSNLIATNDIGVVAGNDVNVEAAINIVKETHLREVKKSGLMSSGGFGFTVGKRTNSTENQGETKAAVASTVGSTGGNIAISADKNYKQVGSDVMTPNGSIDIAAQKVDILEARETSIDSTETIFKQSGLTVAVSSPVIAAVQAVDSLRSASKKTDDARMKGLAAASAALSVYDAAAETMAAVSQGDSSGGGIKISITVGRSKSESKTTQISTAASGSSVAAGGNVNIKASGAEDKSDVTIQGSDVTAGNDVNIEADDKVNLLAAKNGSTLERESKSVSGGVGLAISYSGGKGAVGFTANAAGSRGDAEGTEESLTQTRVTAGNKLSMKSGSDTNIIGATANGKQVVADVGGDLNIQSVQDTVTYKSKDASLGGSVTVGYGFSGSINGSYSKVKADYASVKEQSGIKAGDEGLHSAVGGLTGNIEGALGAGVSAASASGIAKMVNELDIPDGLKETLIASASTVVGAAVGGASGATAASNEAINNYLANWQKDLYEKELKACSGNLACRGSVHGKWFATSLSQDLHYISGMGLGAAIEAKDIVVALKELPQIVQQIAENPDMLGEVPAGYMQQIQETYNRYLTALETAGPDGATAAGVEFIKLANLLAAPAYLVKGAASVSKATISVLGRFKSATSSTIKAEIAAQRAAIVAKGGEVTKASTTVTSAEIRAIVRETGAPFGKSGQAYNLGSESELNSLFQKITAGAESVSAKYDGTMRVLPDGTRIGLRNASTTGGKTIDVFPASGKPYKIHIDPETL